MNVGDSHAPSPADRGHLRGIAQLQFGPPTLTVPDDSGSTVVTHTPLMARYFPDPGTMEPPEYLRGEIQITLGAEEVFSQAGTFIDVSLVGLGGNIQFIPDWSSAPLPVPQQTAINKAFRNSLVNSFQPSSTPLPSGILNMQFKTMPQDSQALAVLMNLPGGTYATGQALGEGVFGLQPGSGPDPADVTNIFLADGDDFALAVSSDYFSASDIPGNIADKVRDQAKTAFDNAWNQASDQVNQQVSQTLSVDNLNNFLKPVTNPVTKPGAEPERNVSLQLAYTSFQITTSGVILHGTLQVPGWQPAISADDRIYAIAVTRNSGFALGGTLSPGAAPSSTPEQGQGTYLMVEDYVVKSTDLGPPINVGATNTGGTATSRWYLFAMRIKHA